MLKNNSERKKTEMGNLIDSDGIGIDPFFFLFLSNLIEPRDATMHHKVHVTIYHCRHSMIESNKKTRRQL